MATGWVGGSPTVQSMRAAEPELGPTNDWLTTEPRVRDVWESTDVFHAEPVAADIDTYSIVIPPPNVTAALHLGHALNNTLQDVLIRYHRMRGDATLWMPGTDHAGIATQTVVEKRLLDGRHTPAGHGPRASSSQTTQEWKDEYERVIIEQLKAMGASCDCERTRFTMDDMCATAVRHAFFKLFRDGLDLPRQTTRQLGPGHPDRPGRRRGRDGRGRRPHVVPPLPPDRRLGPRHRRHDAARDHAR